jgi:hypothetical protein
VGQSARSVAAVPGRTVEDINHAAGVHIDKALGMPQDAGAKVDYDLATWALLFQDDHDNSARPGAAEREDSG